MVVSVDQVHQLTYYICAKQLSAYPSPDEWNQYAQFANIDLFNYYNDERAKMLLKVKSGEALFAPPILSTYVVENYPMPASVILGTPNYLSASLPNDYAYDISFTTGQITITKIDLEKWNTCINSTIDTPTNAYPVYKELANTMTVVPATLPDPMYLEYYRYPVAPFWNYQVISGVPTYTPIGSVDFEWENTELNRLTLRILGYMGISIRDQELEQYATQMTNQAS